MESNSPIYNLLEIQDIRFSLDKKKLRQSFSIIKVLYLADRQISLLVRFRRLKELIQRQIDKIRNVRLRYKCLYPVVYLEEFFQRAISHTVASILRPFNFTTISRLGNEVNLDFAIYIAAFLRLRKQCILPQSISAAFITSTILLDTYPLKIYGESPITLTRLQAN